MIQQHTSPIENKDATNTTDQNLGQDQGFSHLLRRGLTQFDQSRYAAKAITIRIIQRRKMTRKSQNRIQSKQGGLLHLKGWANMKSIFVSLLGCAAFLFVLRALSCFILALFASHLTAIPASHAWRRRDDVAICTPHFLIATEKICRALQHGLVDCSTRLVLIGQRSAVQIVDKAVLHRYWRRCMQCPLGFAVR